MENSNSSSFSSFQRNVAATSSDTSKHSKNSESCRRKLNYITENSDAPNESKEDEKSIVSRISLSDTRKVLRNGLDRINRTFNNVRTSVGSFTQIFKTSTRRRQILEEGPMTPTCVTPDSRARIILGRTPTKLYSPFGIESPYKSTTYDKENIPNSNKMGIVRRKEAAD